MGSCGACRKLFIKHCMEPSVVTDVASCLKTRCRKSLFTRKQSSTQKICKRGLKMLCEEHVCRPKTVAEATTVKKETEAPKKPVTPKKPATPEKPAIKPCNNDIATEDLPNVIYVAAEAEDCTSELQKEVND